MSTSAPRTEADLPPSWWQQQYEAKCESAQVKKAIVTPKLIFPHRCRRQKDQEG